MSAQIVKSNFVDPVWMFTDKIFAELGRYLDPRLETLEAPHMIKAGKIVLHSPQPITYGPELPPTKYCAHCTPQGGRRSLAYVPRNLPRWKYNLFCRYCSRHITSDYRIFPIDDQRAYGCPPEDYPRRNYEDNEDVVYGTEEEL
jgi:hypothetical protein